VGFAGGGFTWRAAQELSEFGAGGLTTSAISQHHRKMHSQQTTLLTAQARTLSCVRGLLSASLLRV